MSETLDRVRGVRELPLFPLPLVLYPGVPLPLHVFEPRYRQMLKDVRAGNQLFGVSYFDPSESDEQIPPTGHVGCVAELVETQEQPDGRANLITVGLIRYHIESYVERGDPYLVGRPSFFEDEDEADDPLLQRRAREVSELFTRIARSMRQLNDDRTRLPELPDSDPQRLSFLVAAALELEIDAKLELLEMRSSSARLARIRDLLDQAATNYEERARVHTLAKSNGHSGKKLSFE